ncbi:hypothetical protein [Actinoplanes sp. NPDC049681]|uniref:hypothetical protein n=1 Tax=Actinoplanes sp. NPDC049681 TaxID=3363905 RepID=UPI0037998465
MERFRSIVLCGVAALLAAVLGAANLAGSTSSTQNNGDSGGTTACGVTSAEYVQRPPDCPA